jgi:hypothetical protein
MSQKLADTPFLETITFMDLICRDFAQAFTSERLLVRTLRPGDPPALAEAYATLVFARISPDA